MRDNKESIETLAILEKIVNDFFSMHYRMLGVNVYGAYCVGRHDVPKKGLLYAQWTTIQREELYLNSCLVSEDHTISQQSAYCKAYEEKLKKKG